MPTNVLILGAGEIGNAVAHLLRNRPDTVLTLWDKNADKVPNQPPLPTALHHANIVMLCMSSPSIHGALLSVRDTLRSDAVVVALTKGIEQETCRTTDDLLTALLPVEQPWALLSGPMLAEEILQDRPCAAVVGTRRDATFQTIAALFAGSALRITHCKDVKAIALAGVLKNVYALALGIIEATGDGHNMRGIFFTAALNEMRRIMRHLGASPDVAHGLAGLGDMIATATSPYSRNRTVGEEIASGRAQTMESEGVRALHCLPKMLAQHLDEFPMLAALHNVVCNGAMPQTVGQALLTKAIKEGA